MQVGEGEIPEETNGPYPADGTGGVNVLTESGIVRSDIRTSFGTGSATAPGVPLTVTMQVVDVSSATDVGAALVGAAVYVWQCDSEGRYSLYRDGLEDENYLRGVQATDAGGQVSFTTVFPGAYPGRWPHLHFEVYPSLGLRGRPLPADGHRDRCARLRADRDPAGACLRLSQAAGAAGSVPGGGAQTIALPAR